MPHFKSSDLYQFGSQLWRRWILLLTGGSITGLLALWERYKHRSVPGGVYVGILAIFLGIAFYRMWKAQRAEIARLEVRPYDEQRQNLAETILDDLSPLERDLLRFLLLRHGANARVVHEAAIVGADTVATTIVKRARADIIVREEDSLRGSVHLSIRQPWVTVFEDSLFPRNEGHDPFFRGI